MLHWEPGGMVIYSKLLEAGTFGQPTMSSKDELAGTIEWRDLVLIVEGIVEKKDGRRQRLDELKQLRRQQRKTSVSLRISLIFILFYI